MKIALLTNFKEFNFGYSLTSLLFDQMNMLKQRGHEVHIFTCPIHEDLIRYFAYEGKGGSLFVDQPDRLLKANGFYFHPIIPVFKLTDYKKDNVISQEHLDIIDKITEDIKNEIQSFELVFTHDWIFTGWNLPFAKVLQNIAPRIRHIQFYHWIHSIPGGRKNWWDLGKYGDNHKIIFPNKKDSNKVAHQFRTKEKNVLAVPHIKDLRTWFNFGYATKEIIKAIPDFMQKDIIQVYPASTDRMEAKRIPVLLDLLGYFKKVKKISVCLVVANQWGKDRNLKKIKEHMKRVGLTSEDVVFTSEVNKEFKNGVNKETIRELMLCANLFIYPTKEESFGFVGLENMLSGAKTLVLNKDLHMMQEIYGDQALYINFGSYTNPEPKYKEVWVKDTAEKILTAFNNDKTVQVTTRLRKQHNYNFIYKKYYLPWVKQAEALKPIQNIL